MRNTKRFLLAALLILYGASAQAATQPASIEPAASVAEPALAGRLAQSKPGLRAWLASIFRLGKDDTFLTDEQEFSQSDKRYSLGGGKAIDCDYWFNQILPNFFKINPNKITEKNIFLATGVGGLYKSIKDNALSTKEKPGDLNEVVGIFREYAESKFAYNFVTLPEDLPGDDDQKIATKTTLLKAIQESFFKLELFNILLETKLDLLRLYWIRYNIVDTLLANIDKINSQKFINETFSNSVRDVFYAPNVRFINQILYRKTISTIWKLAYDKIVKVRTETELLQQKYLSPKLALIAKFAFIKEENTIETSNAWNFELEPLLRNLTNKDATSNLLNFLNYLPRKADWYSKHRYTIALYLEQLFVYEKLKDFSDDNKTLFTLITAQQIKNFKQTLSNLFALLEAPDNLPKNEKLHDKFMDRIVEMMGVGEKPVTGDEKAAEESSRPESKKLAIAQPAPQEEREPGIEEARPMQKYTKAEGTLLSTLQDVPKREVKAQLTELSNKKPGVEEIVVKCSDSISVLGPKFETGTQDPIFDIYISKGTLKGTYQLKQDKLKEIIAEAEAKPALQKAVENQPPAPAKTEAGTIGIPQSTEALIALFDLEEKATLKKNLKETPKETYSFRKKGSDYQVRLSKGKAPNYNVKIDLLDLEDNVMLELGTMTPQEIDAIK